MPCLGRRWDRLFTWQQEGSRFPFVPVGLIWIPWALVAILWCESRCRECWMWCSGREISLEISFSPKKVSPLHCDSLLVIIAQVQISHRPLFSGQATTFSVIVHGDSLFLAPFMQKELYTGKCGELSNLLCIVRIIHRQVKHMGKDGTLLELSCQSEFWWMTTWRLCTISLAV